MTIFLRIILLQQIHYLARQSQNIFYSVLRLERHSNALVVLKVDVGLDPPRVVPGGAVSC